MSRMFATPEVRQARADVCRACPDATPAGRPLFCGRCGCPLVSKVRFARASCPAGKWSTSNGDKR